MNDIALNKLTKEFFGVYKTYWVYLIMFLSFIALSIIVGINRHWILLGINVVAVGVVMRKMRIYLDKAMTLRNNMIKILEDMKKNGVDDESDSR